MPISPELSVLTPGTAALTLTTGGFVPVPRHRTLRIAVYDGAGTSETRAALCSALAQDADLCLGDVTAAEIRAGRLKDEGFDALVHPGGSGGEQGRALENAGRDRVRDYVQSGGGYLGICAGAYLATCDYPWSLGILNARVLDREHWARGHGPVTVSLNAAGRSLLGAPQERLGIVYWQGPLLGLAGVAGLPEYRELATFASEVRREGVPGGVMPGTTAIAAGRYGQGRVLCFSPHPEKTAGQEPLLHHALLWLTGEDALPRESHLKFL